MSIKKILKSGFYRLSDFWDFEKLEIENNLNVVIFDEWKNNKEIIIWENSEVKISWVLEKENDYKSIFRQTWNNSKVEIKYLLLSKNEEKVKAKIHSLIESNDSVSDVFISSICSENGEIDLDWIIELAPNFRKMAGHLIEENIFLWEKWKIRWIPTLLVKSNEVEASHACKIEKIPEEELFYLRSRWIDKKSATYVLIESKVKNIFSFLEKEEFYEEFLEKTLAKIF